MLEYTFHGLENLGRFDNANFRAMFAESLLCQLSWRGPSNSIVLVEEVLSFLKPYIPALIASSKVKGKKTIQNISQHNATQNSQQNKSLHWALQPHEGQ